LIADEPTGNLDTETGRRIMDLFFELHRTGFTIILVTHDPNVGSFARRAITVQDGLIINDQKALTPLPRKWAQRPLRVQDLVIPDERVQAFIS
ncbi:MAG: macrolide ABC transporter permease/ATP-binding protein MacB, partial [Actinobacteria bacterium]|nr:macrolide ABC transporter permease/ATP-binding protein MacB [Actinomycetota bacterium]